jgi:nicotinate-nucleotide adenylyltransferase
VRRLLFGGSFDPVHTGHLEVARAAARALGAERVSLIPAADAPHKPGAARASGADRLAMCRLAVAGDPLFDVLDAEVRRGGVSYTIDTVRELLGGPLRGDQVLLLVGQDQLRDLARWREAAALVALVPVAVAPRPGAAEPPWEEIESAFGRDAADGIRRRLLPIAPVDVSSTDVRRRVAEGRSIRCRVPDAVADYIEARGLYRD